MLLTFGLVAALAVGAQVPGQARKVAAFRAVTVKIPVQVELRLGTAAAVSVEGDPALLPAVTTEVRKDNLTVALKPKATLPANANVKVIITFTKLDGLRVSEPASVVGNLGVLESFTLQADKAASVMLGIDDAAQVTVEAGNGARVRLSGNTNALGIGASGEAVVDAVQLAARTAAVNGDSGAQVSVQAMLLLQAEMDNRSVLRTKGATMNRQVHNRNGAQVLEER